MELRRLTVLLDSTPSPGLRNTTHYFVGGHITYTQWYLSCQTLGREDKYYI